MDTAQPDPPQSPRAAFGALLRQYRLAAGLTQEESAGFTVHIETGTRTAFPEQMTCGTRKGRDRHNTRNGKVVAEQLAPWFDNYSAGSAAPSASQSIHRRQVSIGA